MSINLQSGPVCLACLFLTCLVSIASASPRHQSSATIAILTDGPAPETEAILSAFKEQLAGLNQGKTEVKFPSNLQRQGDWDRYQIERHLQELLARSDVDVVITLGVIGSGMTAALEPALPVVAPFVIDAQLQSFPVTVKGTSGVENLHYLANPRGISADIARFQQATGANHIAVVAEARVTAAIPAAGRSIRRVADQLGIVLTSVEVENRAGDILAALPEDVDAVFFLPLLGMSAFERQQLVDGLVERKLPSFSALGRPAVEQGMLMGASLVPPGDRLGRQLAVDVSDILRGRLAGELPVTFEVNSRLTLNMKTARSIGYAPPFDILYEADLLNDDVGEGRKLSLQQTVSEALERNLAYAIAQEELLSAGESTQIAQSTLLPQITLNASSQAFDRDLVNSGSTRTTSAGVGLSQLIYSESVTANYAISQRLEAAQAADAESVRLDIVQQAAQGYLNVLVSKTQLRIQRDNLKVTRANLERAQFRYKIGAADRSEVHRFETALGGSQQDVSNAQALYLQTMNQLNQILHRPIEEPFQPVEPGLGGTPIFGDPRLSEFISDTTKARIFRDFLVKEALVNAPELVAVKEQMAAQERSLKAAKRARYVPDILLTGSLDRIVDEDGGDFNIDRDEDWSVGVQLELPLYSGNKLEADKRQARIELRRLQLQERQIIDGIETQARFSVHKAGASRTNIGFARSAAEASTKTLEMVTDAYTRGSASDVDLIDAQNAALVAHLSSANAEYQFLLDLMDVERSIGFFDFFVDPARKEAWFDRLNTFSQQWQEGQRR